MADLTYTIVLFAVMLFNIIVLLMRKPLLSYLVGIITISFVAAAFTDSSVTVVFSPYVEVMVFFVTIVCLLDVSMRR